MRRRSFLKGVAVSLNTAAIMGGSASAEQVSEPPKLPKGTYRPGSIVNEYISFLSGERELLNQPLTIARPQMDFLGVDATVNGERRTLKIGQSIKGWKLLAILPWHNGLPTAVFEKHVTHRGAIVFINEEREVARIPKQIGDLSKIGPRGTNSPHGMKFIRPTKFVPGPDTLGQYILGSSEDPSYENVAALGPEYIGWTLVSDEGVGPIKSLWLEPDGRTRQFGEDPQSLWAPDTKGRLFEPSRLLALPYLYGYRPGYSKRTMLGGFLPAADVGVWNPENQVGYEVMMVLSSSPDKKPLARVRATVRQDQSETLTRSDFVNAPDVSDGTVDRYWNGSATEFYSAVLGLWQRWTDFFGEAMAVEIPDEWLLNAAKAGIIASRCSYRGLEPTYQICEGAYTKIPERSHALFPVAHYEFVWAQQLWNLTNEVEPQFQHYLNQYVLPNGNFVYNTQDQVEAPLNIGVFLRNSARAYDYTHDFGALQNRLPTLRHMVGLVKDRWDYSKATFPETDPRHGLIWGSPEADNGDPDDDTPNSHPYYYQNAAWIWRGLTEHARCMKLAGEGHSDKGLIQEGSAVADYAASLRADVEHSLTLTLNARNPELKRERITPISALDTTRKSNELSSYENHRYLMDWWTADWGDPELDEGHFRHRNIAGLEVLGMNVANDGIYGVESGTLLTSNFMEHGTLAGRIRQVDYRPFLLTLYGNLCFAMDSGNHFAPEDALLPAGYAGEGAAWMWSPVVNSALQPTLALRWLLCYEESNRDTVHLQKAAPKPWFAPGQNIKVRNCPTRFGRVTWSTESSANQSEWNVNIQFLDSPSIPFGAELIVHIHPADNRALKTCSLGRLSENSVAISPADLSGKTTLSLTIR
jgi:hypothetical protein